MDKCDCITIHIKQKAAISFPFDFTGEIMQLVNRFGLDILAQDYSAGGIRMQIDIPVGRVDGLAKEIINRSYGKIKLELENK